VADFFGQLVEVRFQTALNLVDERPDRLLNDVFHDVLGRVVATGLFALRAILLPLKLSVFEDQLVFKQPLVDRPQLAHIERAVIEESAAAFHLGARQ